MTKLAIMQPYVLPYLGYFHLIHACDKFVFLDDVNFINRGWINRNRIISQDKKSDLLFTLPLDNASQNKNINEVTLHDSYIKWREKFKKTFAMTYATAPFLAQAKIILHALLDSAQPGSLISDVAKHSIQLCATYFGIQREWVGSSGVYKNQELKKGSRLVDICKKAQAHHYVNAIGGKELYTTDIFAKDGIKLSFVKSQLNSYREPFLPGLSILDLIAYCDPETLHQQLLSYHLE